MVIDKPSQVQIYDLNGDDSYRLCAGAPVLYDAPTKHQPLATSTLMIPVDAEALGDYEPIRVAQAIAKGFAKHHVPKQVHYYAPVSAEKGDLSPDGLSLDGLTVEIDKPGTYTFRATEERKASGGDSG